MAPPLTEAPPTAGPSWLRRLGWLVLIWAASVLTLFGLAQGLRQLMHLAGMST